MSRVLLLAPPFFGYCKDVEMEIRGCGIDVERINDRPSDGVIFKSLSKISYQLVQRSIDNYFSYIYRKVSNEHYDLLFALGGMSWCFNVKQTKMLKEASGSKLLLYLWDSIENCQRVGEAVPYFDRVFSFDPVDCDRFGLEFLPLFYSFEPPAFPPTEPYEYDACFVGSVHQVDKFLKIKSIIDRLESAGARVFKHYYIPSRSVAILRSASIPEYRKVELTTEPLSREGTLRVYRRSRVLVDSPQAGQRGLTIRTIESIGMNRRLITANKDIRKYDFYAAGNITVDDGAIDVTAAIIDPVPYPVNLRETYSIKSWTRRILEVMEV